MVLSSPWDDSYPKNYFETPTFHHHWWYFGINGSSATETELDRTQQENIDMIALKRANKLMITGVTKKP